jgi:hypothetical protein
MRRTPLLSTLVLAFLLGCLHDATTSGVRISKDLAFRDAAGATSFRLASDSDGIRAESGRGDLLARIELRDEYFVILDAQGTPLASVVPGAGLSSGLRLLSPEGELLLRISSEPDGDLKVANSEGDTLYKAKKRDYGFKVVDQDGQLESSIRAREQKTSLRDAEGETFLSTRGSLPPSAVAILSMSEVRFEFAVGLAVALAHWQLDEPSPTAVRQPPGASERESPSSP